MVDQDLSENPVRELLRRFFITILLGVVVYRFGAVVPIPGVDVTALKSIIKPTDGSEGSAVTEILKYANMFNGGTIANGSIFGLGIMPYISASIILQLLTFSFPALKALQKEGESGRRKINQYTRYATVLICLVQSAMAAFALAAHNDQGKVLVSMDSTIFIPQSVLVITTGSMLLLWLAEQITKFGIGNGVSVIIMIGILASIPSALDGFAESGGLPDFLLLAAVSLAIIAGIVIVVQAVRKINLEQQRRIQGNKVYGGATTTLPLKLNQANVIPVIFASPVMFVLIFLTQQWGDIFAYNTPMHRYTFAALIIGFTYFYISITFDLNDLSNHFKTAGFFVRGIKPGKKTVDFLTYHLHRITFVGAIFLAMIAILPEALGNVLNLGGRGGAFLMGGTGLLIVVGVALDVMQKVASFFLAHQYRGMTDSASPTLGGGAGNKKLAKRF
jgi:preprotein translocase subunit SecY